jgi:hypothetical protein
VGGIGIAGHEPNLCEGKVRTGEQACRFAQARERHSLCQREPVLPKPALQRAWAAPQLVGESSQREAVWRVRGNARQHAACRQAKTGSFNEAQLFAVLDHRRSQRRIR